jgi:OOP family OmpA-OmpF porin
MMSFKLLGVVAALGILAGCASDIEQIRNSTPSGGSEFTAALAEEYKQFALYEADEMYDWPDASCCRKIWPTGTSRSAPSTSLPPPAPA